MSRSDSACGSVQQFPGPRPDRHHRGLLVSGAGRDGGQEPGKTGKRPVLGRQPFRLRGEPPVLARVRHSTRAAHAHSEAGLGGIDPSAPRAPPRLDHRNIRLGRNRQPDRRPRPLAHLRPDERRVGGHDEGELTERRDTGLKRLNPLGRVRETIKVDEVQRHIGAAVGTLPAAATGSAADARRHRQVASQRVIHSVTGRVAAQPVRRSVQGQPATAQARPAGVGWRSVPRAIGANSATLCWSESDEHQR